MFYSVPALLIALAGGGGGEGGMRPAIFFWSSLRHFGCDRGVWLGGCMVETCCNTYLAHSCIVTLRAWCVAPYSLWMGVSTMYHSRYGCAVEIWVFISLASPIAYLFDTIYRVFKDRDKHCSSVWIIFGK